LPAKILATQTLAALELKIKK